MDFININYLEEFSGYKLDDFLALQGELLSQDSISDVIKVNLNNCRVVIKRYQKPSKNFFRALVRYSRLAAKLFSKPSREFKNLLFFANNGFLTPEIIYFDQANGKSCLVTKELLNSQDLAKFYKNNEINRQNFTYLLEFTSILKRLHAKGFIHRDFKLRNVILSEDLNLYLIDCPEGYYFGEVDNRVSQVLKQRELAKVYKDLKKRLTNSQLLRLYKHYYGLGKQKLIFEDRCNILKIIGRYK